MGSKGSKPRKPKHSQHLAKVGTTTENRRLMHDEQNAVLHQMGLHDGASSGARMAFAALIAFVVFGGVLALITLTVVR
jgi:hypothetical protein